MVQVTVAEVTARVEVERVIVGQHWRRYVRCIELKSIIEDNFEITLSLVQVHPVVVLSTANSQIHSLYTHTHHTSDVRLLDSVCLFVHSAYITIIIAITRTFQFVMHLFLKAENRYRTVLEIVLQK